MDKLICTRHPCPLFEDAGLRFQVRDFMLFIEAQKVLETSGNGAELRDGSVLALPANLAPSKSSTRTARQGKKKR